MYFWHLNPRLFAGENKLSLEYFNSGCLSVSHSFSSHSYCLNTKGPPLVLLGIHKNAWFLKYELVGEVHANRIIKCVCALG